MKKISRMTKAVVDTRLIANQSNLCATNKVRLVLK
jgi:hypothetical protein